MIEDKEISWTKGMVLICQKCGMTFKEGLVLEPLKTAENLKNFLRKKMADDGFGNELRVIPSGCLNICEGSRQAVAYLPLTPSQEKTEIITCHPENDKEALYEWVKERASK